MAVTNFAEFVEALSASPNNDGYTIVALAPDAVIVFTDSTALKRSKTIIKSEVPSHPGTIKLKAKAGWSSGITLLSASGLANLTFENIIIDGGYSSQSGEPRGKGYYNLVNLRSCTDITIRGCKLLNGGNDGFQFRSCSEIEISDCKAEYLGHDVFYFLGSNKNIEVYNNDVLTFTNSAVRLSYGCTNAHIHDNYFHSVFTGGSTGPAIEIDKHGFSGILIENNIIEDVNGCAIWMTADAVNTGSIVIRNCVFINTGVYKSYTGYSNAAIVNGCMDDVLIENCTFIGGNVAYATFDRNGLGVAYHAILKNCIMFSADVAAFRLTAPKGTVSATNCDFYDNKNLAIGNYASNVKYSNTKTVNPQLTDSHKVGESSALYGTGIGYCAVTQDEDDVAEPVTNIGNTSDCDCRVREASPGIVYTQSPYLDVGKSSTSTRSLIYYDLSEYTAPVYNAKLRLCWYFPEAKTRVNDTIVGIYRPMPWSDSTATWKNAGTVWFDRTNTRCGSKGYDEVVFSATAAPDKAFHDFDVTALVNEYITGKYANTGMMLKAVVENSNYIAFYGMGHTDSVQRPRLVITKDAPATVVKIPISLSNRYREDSPNSVLIPDQYLDVGRSARISRFAVFANLATLSAPVKRATLNLAWYYPPGKSRAADTVVQVFRPAVKPSTMNTWNNAGTAWFDKTGVTNGSDDFGSVTIKAAVLPDGKFETIDITSLVNEYISGTYENLGFFVKAESELSNYIAFYSQNATNVAQRPYISVTL